MPSRYVQKLYAEEANYHVYNRGVGKRTIFKDDEDYKFFIDLCKRHLSEEIFKDKNGREYNSYHADLKLAAFCLMPNHYHMLLYQINHEAMTSFMRSVCTAYSMYFNKKYKRVGPLFQSRFRASLISNDAYLQHVSRYIHLNPVDYQKWEFSSLPYYLGQKQASWVDPNLVLDLFEGSSYIEFLKDYEAHRKILKEIKSELADV